VSTHGGHVTLRGKLPADEAARLGEGVRTVRGVTEVDNQIRVH
jgi:osmotically-inducible protein OsmY